MLFRSDDPVGQGQDLVELDEILALADRILVMHDGRIVGEVEQAAATERAIGLMMAGISATA